MLSIPFNASTSCIVKLDSWYHCLHCICFPSSLVLHLEDFSEGTTTKQIHQFERVGTHLKSSTTVSCFGSCWPSEYGPFVEVLPPAPNRHSEYTSKWNVHQKYWMKNNIQSKFGISISIRVYPQIFPVFGHSPSPLVSCPGASAQKVGHVRFWEWSHSSRLGSVWVNPWERRPDRWDGHGMMLLKFSQSHWNKSNVYYI